MWGRGGPGARRLTVPAALLVVAAALTGCGGADALPDRLEGDPDRAATPEALAAAGLVHLLDDVPDLEVRAVEGRSRALDGRKADHPLEAVYALTVDGDDLQVLVATGSAEDMDDDTAGMFDGCTELDPPIPCEREDLGDGVTMRTVWSLGQPDEDPGVLTVVVRRPDAVVLVQEDGPFIEDRDTPMPVPVETLRAIASDPLVGPTTSEEVLALGDDVPQYQVPRQRTSPQALARAVVAGLGDPTVGRVAGASRDGVSRVLLDLELDGRSLRLEAAVGHAYGAVPRRCDRLFPDATDCALDRSGEQPVVRAWRSGDDGWVGVRVEEESTDAVVLRLEGGRVDAYGEGLPLDDGDLVDLAAATGIDGTVERTVNDDAAGDPLDRLPAGSGW